MTIWWITLISTFALSWLAFKTGKIYKTNTPLVRYKANKIVAVIPCMILIIIAGLRLNIGDTHTYMASFRNNIPSDLKDFFRTIDYEGDWGFDLFQTVIKQIFGNEPQYMIFICAFITIGCIFIVFYKYSDCLELAVFYFITAGNYLTAMNGIRQYLVSAILFLAFPLVIKKKWKSYFALVLILSSMHKSALIFIPLYFVINAKAWGAITKWILIIGVGLFVTYPVSGPIIAEILGESQYGRYGDMLMSSGGGANILRVLVYAVPVVMAYLGKKNEKMLAKPEYNLVVNMSCVNLIFILLATKYWIYARFNMYFSLYAILLLCWCVKYVYRRYSQLLYVGSIVAYGIYYWYEMYISLGQVYMSNYIKL